jgi:choline/glycine/proline betaine transport protein
MFIATISYGRTIREFVVGVLFAPLFFTIFWFTVFGGTALDVQLEGAGGLTSVVADNLPVALFAMLENFPLFGLTAVLSLVVICIFFATSPRWSSTP